MERQPPLLGGSNSDSLTTALETLTTQLNAFGISVIVATLTPCDGSSGCTSTVEANRDALNTWIQGLQPIMGASITNGSAEFDSAVAIIDPNSTTTPAAEMLDNAASPNDDDSGDHINLTADGYVNVAATINLAELAPYAQSS
jgi:hypothetical protein